MISCYRAPVSLKCSIVAAPSFTNIIWYSFFPCQLLLSLALLPFAYQLPLLPNSVPLGPPRNSLLGFWLSNSPGDKSVLIKFTTKLTSLVLKSLTLSVLSLSLGYIWSSSAQIASLCLLILVRGTDILPGLDTQNESCLISPFSSPTFR